MSEENVELVRAVYGRWLQGDYSTADWADSDVEFVMEAPGGGTWRGREAMGSSWRDFLHAWQDFRVGAVKEIIDAGDKVLADQDLLAGEDLLLAPRACSSGARLRP